MLSASSSLRHRASSSLALALLDHSVFQLLVQRAPATFAQQLADSFSASISMRKASVSIVVA